VWISAVTLFWQLLVLFACCSGVGLVFRFLIPPKFPLLQEMLFSLMGGLFLVVLIPQNLVYLGMPVRISAWLLLAAALGNLWWCRQRVVAWIRAFYSNLDIRTLAVVILLTIIFHGIAPIQQGLEWYYGKGYEDQLNYVLLAEFLKEEPYGTSNQDIGLRPWLIRPVGFQVSAQQLGRSSGPGVEVTGLKKERLGQSIITAEISVWSGTNGKGGYAATVIFFLTLLAICLYVVLRETEVDCFMAGAGALLAAFLPAVTRLSLDGFLSQLSILFAFPFFASLLRRRELSTRSFTLFFSLTLAYLVAAYSEIAPLGLCTLFLGVWFVRPEEIRFKRLILMSAILLIALINPYYLGNLIEFLGQQFYTATNAPFMDHMAPNLLALPGWSELIFGTVLTTRIAWFFDSCVLSMALFFLAGTIYLSRCDRLIFAAIILPCIVAILYLATRTAHSAYPIAKITLSILPFVLSLVFVALSRIAGPNQYRPTGVLKRLFCAMLVAAAAAGSARYYFEVLNNNGGTLREVREARFQNVCQQLEGIKGKRILVFETYPWLIPWLYYHARQNHVYFDGRYLSDSGLPQLASASGVPDLATLDFVATRDRIIDLRAPSVSCLTLVDDTAGEDRGAGHVRYLLGPPAHLRFLALRSISANLKMRLAPGPEATTFPIDYFLADDQGHVSPGRLWGNNVDVRRMHFAQGPFYMQLSVMAKDQDRNTGRPFPILAELDGLEISDIDLNPGD
jgi:hypothetical protein